jgi:lipopolysaccharide biosynthesis regulator YciM
MRLASQGLRDADAALELDPASAAAMMCRADAFFQLERYSDAAQQYEAVPEGADEHAAAKKRLEECHAALGTSSEAAAAEPTACAAIK